MDEQFLTTFENLNPGDKLIVRCDLKKGLDVPFDVAEEMECYAGQEVTVAEVVHSGKIYIKEDDGDFMWSPPMFVDNAPQIPLSQYLM